MKNMYEIILFAIILFLYSAINLKLIYKEKDTQHLIYKFMIFVWFLFFIQEKLYLTFFKMFVFAAICFVFWAIFNLYSQNKNSRINKNNNLYKLKLNFVSIVSVLTQISFHIFKGFESSLIVNKKEEFLVMLLIMLISQVILKLISDFVILKKVFYNKDGYRNLFLGTEAVFVLIFIFETLYTIVNINSFKFI